MKLEVVIVIVMQAVILAAGLGTRMRPLTNTTAKPLLKIRQRTLLDYTFDALPDVVHEVVIVVGYLGEQIRLYLGEKHRGKTIKYVEQKRLEGTAKALFEAKPLLNGRFLVLMADDICSKKDIKKCLQHERAMLVSKSESAGPGGKVVLDEKENLKDVIEGKRHPAGSLISTNVFVLTAEIFNYKPVKLVDREGEWGLPQTVSKMARDLPVAVVEATCWIKITTPSDLALATTICKK